MLFELEQVERAIHEIEKNQHSMTMDTQLASDGLENTDRSNGRKKVQWKSQLRTTHEFDPSKPIAPRTSSLEAEDDKLKQKRRRKKVGMILLPRKW
jgi:hypothetical protein